MFAFERKGKAVPKKPAKMILFYSGSTSMDSLPERVLAESNPGVMLTYWEMRQPKGETYRRLALHAKRKEKSCANQPK